MYRVFAGLEEAFEFAGVAGAPGFRGGAGCLGGFVLGDQGGDVRGEVGGQDGGLVGDDLGGVGRPTPPSRCPGPQHPTRTNPGAQADGGVRPLGGG
jgi:hypothetical protein